MKCKVHITATTDLAAWVKRDSFFLNVDTNDLARRESEIIYDWYHPEWFIRYGNDEIYFTPPAFEFRNGKLNGINGRHRAILLCKHMEIIPMLLVNSNNWPQAKLTEIVYSEIKKNDIIEIPDLRINKSLRTPPQDYTKTSLPKLESPWLNSFSKGNKNNL